MFEIELFICIRRDLALITYNGWYATNQTKPNQSDLQNLNLTIRCSLASYPGHCLKYCMYKQYSYLILIDCLSSLGTNTGTYIITCIWLYNWQIQCLFHNLWMFLSLYEIIYCNPALLLVTLIFSKLKYIFKVMQFYFPSV